MVIMNTTDGKRFKMKSCDCTLMSNKYYLQSISYLEITPLQNSTSRLR